MNTFNLAFTLEKPVDPGKLRAAIDALVAAFPDVPSIMEVTVIPGREGETVMIPLPMSLTEERQAKIRSTLDDSLAKNGLRKKLPLRR
jgi:hypothetical protein